MEHGFGILLAQWMKENGLSARQLAVLTKCSSKTTVLRLLHDQSTPKQCAAFLHLLKQSSLQPKAEELMRMLASVSPQQIEYEAEACNRLFERLLKPVDSSTSLLPLDQAFQHVLPDATTDIFCMGCPQQSVLTSLLKALEREKTCVTHIMPALSGRTLLTFVSSNIDLLFQPHYKLYIYEESKPETAILRQNLLFMEETTCSSKQSSILFPDNVSCEKLAIGNAQNLWHLIQKRLGDCGASCLCGRDFSEGKFIDYSQFLEECYQKERKCAIDQIKRDIGVEYLPISVVQNAFDGLDVQTCSELQSVAVTLRRSLYARHENLYHGKKRIRLILSFASMRRFVHSGRLSDHPMCLRSFTSTERRDILLFLMEQARNNPNFSLRFAKSSVAPWDYEMVGYEKRSVVIYPASTCYDIQGQYRELELTDPDFSKLYHRFFSDLLSSEKIESESRSVTLLDMLLSENAMRLSAQRNMD